jgi:hypothetical protein
MTSTNWQTGNKNGEWISIQINAAHSMRHDLEHQYYKTTFSKGTLVHHSKSDFLSSSFKCVPFEISKHGSYAAGVSISTSCWGSLFGIFQTGAVHCLYLSCK